MNNNNQNEEKQKIKENKDSVKNETNNKKKTAKKDVSKLDNVKTNVSNDVKNTKSKKQTINKNEEKKNAKENNEKTDKQIKKNTTEKTNSKKKNVKTDNQRASTKNQASKKKYGEINEKKLTEKKTTKKADNNKKTEKEDNKKIETKNQTLKKDIKETSNTKRTVNKDNKKVNKSKPKANNNVKKTNTNRPSINDSIQRLNNSRQKMSSDIQRVYQENQKIKEEKRIIEEESKKVKHLKLIVNIVMIILIILIFIFFVYPGILIKNIRNSKNSQLAQNSINEYQNNHVEQLDETVDIKFTDIATANEGDVIFIIGKDKNGTWEEILRADNETNVLGTYKNKVYYYNSNGLSYIDLTKEEYEETEWIKYKQYKISDTGELGNLGISKATMIDDTIYFEYTIGAGGTLPTDGILSITTNSKSFDNAIQLIADVDKGKWQVDTNNKLIYYIQFEQGKSGPLYKYDLATKQKEKIFDNVESFKIYENKILYYILNNSVTSTETGIYPATYDLYLYNMDNKENKLIYVSSVSNINSGNLWSFAEYYNDDVYYKDENKIIKYNNGEKNIIYTYSSNHGGDYLYGFYFIDKNIVELVIQNGNKKYLVNGNISDRPSGISTINVRMKDGTKKEFRVDKVK